MHRIQLRRLLERANVLKIVSRKKKQEVWLNDDVSFVTHHDHPMGITEITSLVILTCMASFYVLYIANPIIFDRFV